MPASTWLAHVKEVHSKGNTSFKESLKRASASWKKKAKAAPKARKGKKKAVEEEEVEVEAPKKKRRRRRKAGPKVPAKAYKGVDSRNL